MKIIAITGGIGSGKSYASEYIKSKGYGVISCDEITKELYRKEEIINDVISMFPFANENGNLDFSKLSERVFSDKESRKKLENYLHPLIMKEVFERAKTMGEIVFAEVPLLFESGLEDKFDAVLVVVRDKNDRINAVKTRSGLTEEQIIARINNQFEYSKVDKDRYTVIENSGNTDFEKALDEYLKTL